MNIYIVGFMGSGKSTLGKKLAKALEYEFYDLDKLIEDKARCSIADIFKYLGEEKFREMESEILHSFSGKENFVLATGGGAPCHFDNMDFILKNGISIYLEMEPKSIFDRLKKAKRVRPTIAGLNDEQLMEFINETLRQRESVYKRADHIVPGINITTETVTQLISLNS